jgi:hypothetical protein
MNRLASETNSTIVLVEDTNLELIPAERAGQTLTGAQRAFRQQWLN